VKKDETPLTSEQSDLVLKYYPFALKLARSQAVGRPWLLEDFRDAALDALVVAARSFDPEFLPYFGHLARKSIHFALIKRHNKHARRVRLARFFPLDWRDDRGAFDPVPDEPEAFDSLVEGLPAIHREFMKLHYRDGLPLHVAARRIGFGRRKATLVHREALDSLRGLVHA
jgi:DNA-directed RNA polymerase specialized sigma24 family protein